MRNIPLKKTLFTCTFGLLFAPAVHADDIQVYFNAQVNPPAIQANLESKIVALINQSQQTLDIAVYDMDLPGVATAIVDAKDRGVSVRVITDNDNTGAENQEAYSILSNGNVPFIDDTADNSAGSGLQHNKLIVVDGRYVLAGSTNFTQSGIHGDLDAEGNLISDGNDNHILVIDSIELAREVTTQMDLMWGDGPGGLSDSLFGLSKPDHALTTVYTTNDNIRIDVQFTPQSASNYQGSGIDTTVGFVSAGLSEIDIAQFVISAQDIADAAEVPNNSGAVVRGIGDSSFFYRYYSEFQDMLGNTVLKDDGTEEVDSFTGATNNPWEIPADMRVASHLQGGDKWHHKYIRVDDKVLTGSHNASGAGSFTNDETILIIHDAQTAAKFKGHFDLAFCLSGSEQNCTETTFQGGTWEGVTFSGEEVASVLDIVNNATMQQLDIDAAMNKRTAENIISARPIADMDQLEAVPYVGNAAMTDLYDYMPAWEAL